MKKGLLQDGLARDTRGVLADLSALPAITCAAFLSLVGLPSKLCQELCLLGVIQCNLEKTVDHNLKTGQQRTAKGGLPVYLDKVCASVGMYIVVFCHSWMPGCISF